MTLTHDFEVEPLDLLVRGLLPLPLRRVVRLQLLVLLPPSAAAAVAAARLVPPAEQRPQEGGGEPADGRHLDFTPSHYFLEAEQMNRPKSDRLRECGFCAVCLCSDSSAVAASLRSAQSRLQD